MTVEHAFPVTFFSDYAAKTKRQLAMTMEELADLIRTTTARRKEVLPWLKLSRFGNTTTARGSLRWDRNVIAITGAEGDYDGGKVPFSDGVEAIEKAGLRAVVYTSPSHTPDKPRWRVVCPTSREHPPARRAQFVSRINGVLGGILGAESWTLSQSYYYGAVNGNPDHHVEVIESEFVDLLDDLDLTAVGRPATKNDNGHHPSAPGPVDERVLIEQIRTGESYHPASMRLIGSWALRGVPLMDAKARLVDAFEGIPPADRDNRWRARYASIPTMLSYVYSAQAEQRCTEEQAVYAKLPEDLHHLIVEGVDGALRKREIARLAGFLVPQLGPYGALDVMLCWNSVRCRPPLSTAEVFAVIDWIAGRELARPGGHPNGK